MTLKAFTLKFLLTLVLAVFLSACSSLAPREEHANAGTESKTIWSPDEEILSQAFLIRAKALERDSGMSFDAGWVPSVSIEYGVQAGAMYRAATQTIVIPIDFIYRLNAENRRRLTELDVTFIAGHESWAPIADHELGHVLMDQVSRRHGYGPLDLEKLFETVSPDEQLGLNVVMEGVGTYFQYFRLRLSDLSPLSFPSDDERGYTYEMVAMRGGHWLVNDILKRYGERGMVWLIANRLILRGNMRDAAIAYRERALRELAD